LEKNAVSDSDSQMYPEKTFQEYVDSIANIKKMGSYDYMEFCKNMKNKDFKQDILNKYTGDEKMKKIKNKIVYEVMKLDEKTSSMNEQLYDYITKNEIKIPEQKPDGNNFRNNKFKFYETYTLWDIGQQRFKK